MKEPVPSPSADGTQPSLPHPPYFRHSTRPAHPAPAMPAPAGRWKTGGNAAHEAAAMKISYTDLEQKRDIIREIFDQARRIREPELMTFCLSRLVTLSELLGDAQSVRHYRTLHLLLQPVLRELHKNGEPSARNRHPAVPDREAGVGPDIKSGETGKPQLRSHSDAPPEPNTTAGLPEIILAARAEGWLPAPEPATCILTGRFPALTPAETCHFAEGRTGLLLLVAETHRPTPPAVPPPAHPPLPAMALVFNGGYSGAWRPAFVPATTDFNNLALDTVAIWQIDRQSGWSAFLEMTPTNLNRFLEQFPNHQPPDMESSSFSQLLFYRLTDLESARAGR